MSQDENIINIGQIAQYLDAEYSIIERMKIKKETVRRLAYAALLYISIMAVFAFIL